MAGLIVVGLPRLAGADASFVFAAGAVFFAAWGAIGVDAYRRAVRLREGFGVLGEDGGAIDLLWLAVPLLVASTLFWTTGGTLGSPQAVLARYVTDWRADRADDAGLLFDSAPVASRVQAAWAHQEGRLHDELASLQAQVGASGGIDPTAPFDSFRFELAAGDPTDPAGRRATIRIVRRETYRDTFFGLVPTTSERQVPVADVGSARLRMVDGEWRIVQVDLLGEAIGSS